MDRYDDRYEEAMFDDGFSEAEGPASSFDEFDEGDEMDASDEFEGADEMDAGDEFDEADAYEGDQGDGVDGFEAYDEFDEGESADEEALDEVLAYALGAEDSDEFLKRLGQGLRRAGQLAWKHRRGILSAVSKIAPMVPGIGTALGAAANVAGQLLADEASEEEALDAFAELAVRNRHAIPIVAGLAARAVLGGRGAHMSPAARRQAVRTIRTAATQLVQRRGAAAIRAVPRVALSVKRTSVARRTPIAVRPRVLSGTVRRLARQPQLGRRLIGPSTRGRQALSRVNGLSARYGRYSGMSYPRGGSFGLGGGGTLGAGHGGRRITIRGPVTISIRPR